MEAGIVYQCVATEHREGTGAPDRLTVHQGEWAYCPFDARATGHDWQRNPGRTLSMLEYAGMVRSSAEGKGPRATG